MMSITPLAIFQRAIAELLERGPCRRDRGIGIVEDTMASTRGRHAVVRDLP